MWDRSRTVVPDVVDTERCNGSTEGIPKEGKETEKEYGGRCGLGLCTDGRE